MASKADWSDRFGLVVLPGKIIVDELLLDCPLSFPLGSTYLCTYDGIDLTNRNTVCYIKKAKHVKYDQDLFSTFVSSQGVVLARTLVGKCTTSFKEAKEYIHKFLNDRSPKEKKKVVDEEDGRGKFCMYNYTYALHSGIFPGKKILCDEKFSWTTDHMEVIIGFNLYSSFSHSSIKNIQYEPHILAVFENSIPYRVPGTPNELFHYVRVLNEMGVCLKPGVRETCESPRLLIRGYPFEGRILHYQFAKGLERLVNSEVTPTVDEDTEDVQMSYLQTRPEYDAKKKPNYNTSKFAYNVTEEYIEEDDF